MPAHKPPFLRSAFNYDTRSASQEVAITDFGECTTDQSAKEDADINVIVSRFGVTSLPSDIPMPPLSADFEAEVFDFQSSMNLIRAAEESFAALDPHVRDRFGNSTRAFVEYCSDYDFNAGRLRNLDEMRKMGLAVPKAPDPVPTPPMKVEVVNPSTPPK